jgi:hypothetical protein
MSLVPLLSALMLTSAFAQTTPGANATDELRTINVHAPGDGFVLRGTDAMMIRNGVATKIVGEIVLPNGVRVQANGSVTLHDGNASELRTDKLLTFEGSFVDLPVAQQAVIAPSSAEASPSAKADVGISRRDGITMSGADVLITRNGVTQKVTSDVQLPHGVVARADGTVTLANGDKITLRADQVLDLEGVLHEAPVRPNPAGPSPSSSSPRP